MNQNQWIIIVLAISVILLAFPLSGVNIFASKHYVDCNILLQRDVGNPRIAEAVCSKGNECSFLSSLTSSDLKANIGDYVGNIKLEVGGATISQPYTIGLGIPFAPANSRFTMSRCVSDGAYSGTLTLMDGSNYILDSRQLSVNTN
jgi:hypothetical protein